MNRHVAILAAALLAASCGSDKEAETTDGGATAGRAGPATGVSTSAASGKQQAKSSAPGEGLGQWWEDEPEAASVAKSNPMADPEATIARYERECPKRKDTPECRALRSDVEAVFLQALLTVRASQQLVDPRWYRFAAASENPQLACIGVTEVIWDPKRTPQDESLIASALDSSYHAVRGAVWRNSGRVPAVGELMVRSGGFNYAELTGVCLEESRDPTPALKWAGGYPGAQFRPFASNESRRWFTTPDAPEKVFAWFAARGQAARTEQELQADAMAHYMEEMTRLSSDPEVDNTEKMMQVMMNQATDTQWSAPYRDMAGISDVKYVKIAPGQAIAIFRDDVFKATSIVAHEPQEPVNPAAIDMEAATEEAHMRAILQY